MTVNSQVQDKIAACVKDLPQRLQTPSLVVRKSIFNDLIDLVNTTELPDNVVKVNKNKILNRVSYIF